MKTILVIDDEDSLRKALGRFLTGQGYEVETASDGEGGLRLLGGRPFDLLLVDLVLPGRSGVEILREARQVQPHLVSIVMTGFGTIPSAIEAIRAGAYHYVTKPFDLEEIASLIQKALEHAHLREENRLLRGQLRERYGLEKIVGRSAPIQELFRLVEKISEADSTVLISGESGTGKELVARAIHYRSRRAERPFVPVNCAAIPEGLLESELFGHVKGAFTGAVTTQPGRFELAHGGTIFLDEIGDMSPKLQVKVLRVLQDHRFEPVGSGKSRAVDLRVIAATNQDLVRAVREGRFREDLFYRLNVIPVALPPLRERRDDIPLLLDHFLAKSNQENGKAVSGFAPKVLDLLKGYPWPGNVRELENLVERLVILKGSGIIEEKDLPPPLHPNGIPFRELVDRFEKELIRKALALSEGNKSRAAQLLRLNRTTLAEKMRKMRDDDSRSPPGR